MAHWLSKVVALLNAETSDLRALAHLAGEDPRTFYKGTSLAGADLRGQDLRGMEFGSLSDAILDDRTLIEQNTNKNEKYYFKETPDAENLKEVEEFVLIAKQLIRDKKYNDALMILEEGTSLFHGDLEIRLMHATLLYRLEHFQHCEEMFLVLMDDFPGELSVWLGLSKAYRRMRAYNAAIQHAEKMVAAFPHNRRAWIELGFIYETAMHFEKAISTFQKAIEHFPDNAQVKIALGEILLNQGRLKEALSVFEWVVRDSDHFIAKIWREIIAIKYALNEQDDIEHMLENLVVQFPWNPSALFFCADQHAAHGHISAAIDICWKAIKLNRRDISGWMRLSNLMVRAELYSDAIRVLEEAKASSNSSSLWKWQGEIYLKVGEFDQAISLLTQAVAIFPDEPGPFKWLAQTLVAAGLVNEASQIAADAAIRFGIETLSKRWLAKKPSTRFSS